MACPMSLEKIWLDKSIYDEAERKYYENLAKAPLTPLADEVAKARQRLIAVKDTFDKDVPCVGTDNMKTLDNKISVLYNVVDSLKSTVVSLLNRVNDLEKKCVTSCKSAQSRQIYLKNIAAVKKAEEEEDDDDVDLFDSDSDSDDEDDLANKVREERLAAYAAKKSKKPALIPKSNVILDVKPWDDDTDMKLMEAEVRKISCEGLLLGAAKLVPLAYGIHKLQISCVIQDDLVSVDWLQEEIESIEEYVQSVDIAAFNKI